MTTITGYSRLQIALHWIIALLIALQFLLEDGISGAWRAISQGQTPASDPTIGAHVVGGALVLVLAIWRLTIARRRGTPPVAGDSAGQRTLARGTHLGLYALMILMPVSGAMAWFGGVEAAAQTHNILKAVLLALVALHVAGALYHQFVLKDGLINRMRRAEG